MYDAVMAETINITGHGGDQIEVGDAEIEGAPQDRPLVIERAVIPEVLPQAERDHGKLDAASTGTAIADLLIAVIGGNVGHDLESATRCAGADGHPGLSWDGTLGHRPGPGTMAAIRGDDPAVRAACRPA